MSPGSGACENAVWPWPEPKRTGCPRQSPQAEARPQAGGRHPDLVLCPGFADSTLCVLRPHKKWLAKTEVTTLPSWPVSLQWPKGQ